MPTTASARNTIDRSVAARWTPALVRGGHVPIARSFLESYAELSPRLTVGEAMFVVQVMAFKWDTAAPFPSYSTIAKRMGCSVKMARRYGQSLERKGYLLRHLRIAATNRFDFSPLFAALERHLATPKTRSAAPTEGDHEEAMGET